VNPSDTNNRPRNFLIGTIIVGVLLVVVIANLLGSKAPTADPFDQPAGATAPAPSAK